MRGFFRILSLITAATVLSAAVISCVETEQNAYLRSLRRIGMVAIDPVDSASLSDVEKFLAMDVVKANDWLIMSGDSRSTFNLLFYNLKTKDRILALRKGRGPGEMSYVSNILKHDGKVSIYDGDRGILYNVDIPRTISTRMLSADTVTNLRDDFTKPSSVAQCGKCGYLTTNIVSANVWYSYSNKDGKILSSVPTFEYKELSDDFDAKVSHLISSEMISSPDGMKACVANIIFPVISFSSVDGGKLTEYRRYAYPAMGFNGTSITSEWIRNFQCLQADEKYVYALYSGNKFRGGSLPSWECQHLIVYDWSGEPVRHFFLNRNITYFFLEGSKLYCDSSYPDFNIYVYDLEKYL
ncbi:MAG: TolB-like 6-bladed beta-propeller domain-containing protein [Bacteroidales bacterium]|nr:TolB-like 6-bladed beta-propeller domain-containing protein [Bacteroidales bacterium]